MHLLRDGLLLCVQQRIHQFPFDLPCLVDRRTGSQQEPSALNVAAVEGWVGLEGLHERGVCEVDKCWGGEGEQRGIHDLQQGSEMAGSLGTSREEAFRVVEGLGGYAAPHPLINHSEAVSGLCNLSHVLEHRPVPLPVPLHQRLPVDGCNGVTQRLSHSPRTPVIKLPSGEDHQSPFPHRHAGNVVGIGKIGEERPHPLADRLHQPRVSLGLSPAWRNTESPRRDVGEVHCLRWWQRRQDGRQVVKVERRDCPKGLKARVAAGRGEHRT
mmetsp:Transcript_38101/g.108787  ORF Transcript_38101/g.108787 Transcript_38101/m.108787 type:complete len:269 (-) Transcript_38101:478-1284(-)